MATIQLKRDTSANWTAANPTLALAEPGLETDTNRIKYGDGITSWQNLHYASNVAFREVSFPNGAAGDLQGTIAVNGAGKTFICTSTWTASATVTYSTTNNTDYSIGQSGGQLLGYEITPSTLPDIQAVFGTWATGQQYNYPTPGDFTLEVPGITGPRTVTSCGYLSGNGDIWFDIAYVSGDPTTVSIGDAVTIHFTPPQPAIWDKVGDTGNITFNGHNINTTVGGSINVAVTSNSNDDTELDLHTNTIDLYTYNGSAGAELYLDNSDNAHPYAYIGVQPTGSNEQTWTFNKDGNIIFPDQTVQTTAYLGPTVTDPTVWAIQAVSSTKASLTQAVAYDSLGNTFALIYQGPFSGGGETRSSIVKLSNHGDTVWSKDFYNNDSVNPWSLCCDANNDVYAVVQIHVGSVYNNTVVKISGNDGSIMWQVDIQDSNSANNMQAVPMVYSSGGNSFNGVVVAGSAYNSTDSNNDFFIAFINSDGTASVPTATFGDQWNQTAYSVAVNNTTGDILLVGIKESNTDTHYYLEMVKFNILSPTAIWQKQVSVTGDTTYDVEGTDCCLLADGNWAILASHAGSSTYGVITMKVSNTDGSVMWSREVGQGCTNISSSMTTGADGHIYISATTFNNNANGGNAGIPQTSRLVAAYDTSGTSLWQKFFGAPGSNSLIDNNWWNNIGSTGKVLALTGTNLLIGASIVVLAPYPTNTIGVMAQVTTSGDNQVIGPFELTNSALSGNAVALTVTDTTFAFTTSTQTLAAGDTVSVTASTLDYTLFHSGVRPNQLAAGSNTLTLQTTGSLVDQNQRNVLGEFTGVTENTGNYGNSAISIRNASGYKRINSLNSTPQTWFDISDVANQLGVNQYWITGVSMEFQVTSSGIGDYYGLGTMVGTILAAYDYANGLISVTHSETAIVNTSGTSDDFVFSALDLWNAPNGNMHLRAYRTDGNSGQQLDIMWTARVFINPMLVEKYC